MIFRLLYSFDSFSVLYHTFSITRNVACFTEYSTPCLFFYRDDYFQ